MTIPRWLTSTAAVTVLVALTAASSPVRAQDASVRIFNVSFRVVGDIVQIYYDLEGKLNQVYTVRLYLRRESDPSFFYVPVNVTGDIGTIVFPGERHRITWEMTQEFAEGLQGNDFYFIVETDIPKEKGISPLVWIGGGAAVVGGVVLAIVLSSSSDDGPPPPPGDTGFPTPPGRP